MHCVDVGETSYSRPDDEIELFAEEAAETGDVKIVLPGKGEEVVVGAGVVIVGNVFLGQGQAYRWVDQEAFYVVQGA
ncbi:MAG: hypothetical protein DRR06_16505 [Gammaproteobacteria bacterium]|nr:MAG: hypothetical protein DRR06_16505 [Gammaproteobacteria bacterium]